MGVPFLSVPAFAAMLGRPLADGSDTVAGLALQVVSDWIRDAKPNIDDHDSAALLVAFEVTRDVLSYSDFGSLTSFSKTVGPRTKSGTIDRAAVEKFISDRHRRMLGLSARAGARGHFPKCDY